MRHTIGNGLKIIGLFICIFSIVVMSFFETPISKIAGTKDGILALQMLCFGIGCVLWGLGTLTDPESRLGYGRIDKEAARGFALLLGICFTVFGIFVITMFISFI